MEALFINFSIRNMILLALYLQFTQIALMLYFHGIDKEKHLKYKKLWLMMAVLPGINVIFILLLIGKYIVYKL